MSLFSWYYSADALEAIAFWIVIVGGIVDLGVAFGAFIDLRRKDLPKEKEERLERYIAVMAFIAAVCAFGSLPFSRRASALEARDQRQEREQYASALLSQSNKLEATEFNRTADLGLVRHELSDARHELTNLNSRQRARMFPDLNGSAKRLSVIKRVRAEISYEPEGDAPRVAGAISHVLIAAGWSVKTNLPPKTFYHIESPSFVADEGVILQIRPREHPSASAYLSLKSRIGRWEWEQITNREAAFRLLMGELNTKTTIKAKARMALDEGRYLAPDAVFIRVGIKP